MIPQPSLLTDGQKLRMASKIKSKMRRGHWHSYEQILEGFLHYYPAQTAHHLDELLLYMLEVRLIQHDEQTKHFKRTH